MKYPCEVIRDLLPAYCDDVCSCESRQTVEEHLNECPACSDLLKKMRDTRYDDCLANERDNVIKRHKKSVSKILIKAESAVLLLTLLVCFTVNLAVSHTLSWFFIVLCSLAVFASITAVPLLKGKRFLNTLFSFTVSLMLLLLTCCIYSGGNWFFIAAIPTLFGLSVVFLPIAVYKLPQNGFLARNKGLTVMAVNTLLLYLMLAVCIIYTDGAGYLRIPFLCAAYPVAAVWICFLIIRYLKVNGLVKAGLCTAFGGAFTAFVNDVINLIITGEWENTLINADFSDWSIELINSNVFLIVLISCAVIGAALIIAGIIAASRKKKNV